MKSIVKIQIPWLVSEIPQQIRHGLYCASCMNGHPCPRQARRRLSERRESSSPLYTRIARSPLLQKGRPWSRGPVGCVKNGFCWFKLSEPGRFLSGRTVSQAEPSLSGVLTVTWGGRGVLYLNDLIEHGETAERWYYIWTIHHAHDSYTQSAVTSGSTRRVQNMITIELRWLLIYHHESDKTRTSVRTYGSQRLRGQKWKTIYANLLSSTFHLNGWHWLVRRQRMIWTYCEHFGWTSAVHIVNIYWC